MVIVIVISYPLFSSITTTSAPKTEASPSVISVIWKVFLWVLNIILIVLFFVFKYLRIAIEWFLVLIGISLKTAKFISFVLASIILLIAIFKKRPTATQRLYKKWPREMKYREALQCAEAGRYEDAAIIFEQLNNPDKAREMRNMNRTQYVETRNSTTTKNTTVNTNQLISQLKEFVNYKCPNCGAGIDINSKTSVSGLQFCSHCGTGLNLLQITNYLENLTSE